MTSPAPDFRSRDRLDRRIAEGRLKPRHVRSVAKALALVHRDAEPASERDTAASPAALARRWRAALQALERGDVVSERERDQLDRGTGAFLTRGVEALLERHADGRVRHGCRGLTPAAISVRGRMAGIEASPGGEPGDAAEDLAVLASALRASHQGPLAEQLLAAYALAADDYGLYRVFDFHACLAACEQAATRPAREAREWVVPWLAGTHPETGTRPSLILLIGRVASGKSTLAKGLVRRLSAPRVVADRVRNALLDPVEAAAGHEAALRQAWSDAFDVRGYRAVLQRASAVLESGRTCVVDACSPTREARAQVARTAEACGAELLLCTCRSSSGRRTDRLNARDERDQVHDGSWASIAKDLDGQFEEVDALEPGRHIAVRTDAPLADSVDAVVAALARQHDPAPLQRRSALLPRAVTFDCWNTLILERDWPEAHRLRVEALHAATIEEGDERDYDAVSEAFDRAWLRHMELWREGVVSGAREVACWSLTNLGLPRPESVVEHLTERFQTASHTGSVVALEGARETLERLRAAGVPAALVCDTGLTPGREVRRLLARVGLLELLKAQLFSDEVGAPKPDPRIFRAALDALGARADETVHVGDLLRTDVAGARELGLGSVRLRATNDDDEGLPEADAVASSHEELWELLGVG